MMDDLKCRSIGDILISVSVFPSYRLKTFLMPLMRRSCKSSFERRRTNVAPRSVRSVEAAFVLHSRSWVNRPCARAG